MEFMRLKEVDILETRGGLMMTLLSYIIGKAGFGA